MLIHERVYILTNLFSYRDEYRKSNANEAITWNIKETECSAVEKEEQEEDEEDEDAAIKKELSTAAKSAGRSNLK